LRAPPLSSLLAQEDERKTVFYLRAPVSLRVYLIWFYLSVLPDYLPGCFFFFSEGFYGIGPPPRADARAPPFFGTSSRCAPLFPFFGLIASVSSFLGPFLSTPPMGPRPFFLAWRVFFPPFPPSPTLACRRFSFPSGRAGAIPSPPSSGSLQRPLSPCERRQGSSCSLHKSAQSLSSYTTIRCVPPLIEDTIPLSFLPISDTTFFPSSAAGRLYRWTTAPFLDVTSTFNALFFFLPLLSVDSQLPFRARRLDSSYPSRDAGALPSSLSFLFSRDRCRPFFFQ